MNVSRPLLEQLAHLLFIGRTRISLGETPIRFAQAITSVLKTCPGIISSRVSDDCILIFA
nr:hypothetical protein [Dehalococcoides mccartyi]